LSPRVHALAALLALSACQQELGRPPVPRFTIDPAYVPEHDDFATEVSLDGSASADELDDPTIPLAFSWHFDDDRVRIVDGDVHSSTLRIATAGDRPLTISLAVEDDDGQTSTLEQRLGLTLPDPG
jgi:hypothetical protein